ncbi:hypothetical protein D3C72_1191280 [compost metagenome]
MRFMAYARTSGYRCNEKEDVVSLFCTDLGIPRNDPVEGTQSLCEIPYRDAGKEREPHGMEIGRSHHFASLQAKTWVSRGVDRRRVQLRDRLVVDPHHRIGSGRECHSTGTKDLCGRQASIFEGLGNRNCVRANNRRLSRMVVHGNSTSKTRYTSREARPHDRRDVAAARLDIWRSSGGATALAPDGQRDISLTCVFIVVSRYPLPAS